jgi:serine/threonine-protein kinase
MSLQGRVLGGRYALGPRVGAGGMADVYQATDRVLGRTVAVKVLHFPDDRDPEPVTRFQREAKTAAGLSHPNIVAVYDTGADDGLYYIVMEHVDGENLADLLDRQGPLAPATAAQIGWSVCQALAAAHERGLVHRDVKPANVIVSRTGAVKVTDFGIAKAMATTTAGRTGSGPVLGTASYMSPEQAQGQRVDERSDLYSLGCVLYALLTGSPPFVNDTAIGVIWQHVAEEPVPVAERRPDAGPGLTAVVGRALAKRPDDRYQTADAMGDDLERAAGALGAAGVPSRPTAGVTGAATMRRRPALAGWALLGGLVLVVLLLAVLLRGGLQGGERGSGAVAAGSSAGPPPSTPPPPTTVATTTARTVTSTTARSSTTTTTGASTTTPKPPPTRPGLPAALADLTEVLTAGVLDGTVTPHAHDDLVHGARDVVTVVRAGDDAEARKKIDGLGRKTEELIDKGEIKPAAAGRVRDAVAAFGAAAERAI